MIIEEEFKSALESISLASMRHTAIAQNTNTDPILGDAYLDGTIINLIVLLMFDCDWKFGFRCHTQARRHEVEGSCPNLKLLLIETQMNKLTT